MPEVMQARDRGHAEAEFRFGMMPPLLTLIAAITYRTSAWLVVLAVVPLWLVFLGSEQYGQADAALMHAIANATLTWHALDHLDTARVRYRPLDAVLAQA